MGATEGEGRKRRRSRGGGCVVVGGLFLVYRFFCDSFFFVFFFLLSRAISINWITIHTCLCMSLSQTDAFQVAVLLSLLLLCNECNGRCKVSATFVAIISLALHSVCMHILDLWLKVRMMMMLLLLLLLFRLTDWLTAGYPLLPSSHTKSSGNYYKHTILFYQLNAVPLPAPFASLPSFVYLVFVSFLHAHKIKCNNSKRCNNSVRYLSRFLFYFSLCLSLLSLSVVFSFAYLIFLLFYSQPAHSLCIYISGLQHAR